MNRQLYYCPNCHGNGYAGDLGPDEQHCYVCSSMKPVTLYPMQWCDTHNGPTNRGEKIDDDCLLMDMAPPMYTLDPDPELGP